MLAESLLPASFRQGVVRLLPKVAGIPAAPQLRHITLLGTDYKLLTKILVARLLPVLPSVLQSTQLCSVRGRSIFDGPATILSAAEYLHRHQKPGYLLSLNFFHAYDRVSLSWVDKVMEAMGFLVRLEACLRGLQVAHIREASFGYMDDVEILGSHLSDIKTVDTITLAFEAATEALLNRNRKTLILG
jgi:hypothetical protein